MSGGIGFDLFDDLDEISDETDGGYSGYGRYVDADEIQLSKTLQKREQASATVGRDTNREFMGFKTSFLNNIDLLKSHLQSVYTDKTMGVDEIYSMTTNMFSSIRYEMDAVLYLNAIYSSEYYIVEHCLRVGLLAKILAYWMNYDSERMKDAAVAGFIHDIGMLQVPKQIIEKQGKLTSEEFAILQDHGIRGSLMLINKGVKNDIIDAVRFHHERYDGSGYPKGKKGNDINELAALISIVDVYDSMTSNRPYRLATCPFEVIDVLEKQMIDKFNPGLLYTFLQNIPFLYIGSLVKLSDGRTGTVVFIDKNHKTSPIVQLEKTGECVDLYTRRDLKVDSLL